jgi:hypothetical protein
MGFSFLTGYVLGPHGNLHDVNDRVDRLTLVVEAMWSLLEDNGYTEEQLKARVEEIDAADGTVDHKRTPRAGICTSCGAKVGAALPACQFCGGQVAGGNTDPFAGV